VFDEWRVFRGLDMTRSIAHLSKDEFVKDLVDMFSSFVLQVAKKGDSMYFPSR